MASDIEIAQKCALQPIEKIASSVGLKKDEIELYGRHTAKVDLSAYEKRKDKKDGRLILVTTMSPTPFGEGKTTVTIGLAQALKKLGKKVIACIREPSLGPTMGVKGGAAGGGYSQVLPMEDINLHFTGDMYMVGATHNLLAAMVDNHIYFGNELNIDKDSICWPRVVDMNDRALRNITLKYKDTERKASFDITAASEVMAVLCLSMNLDQLREKLSRIIIGFSKDGVPVTAKDLKASGAMALLLKEAIKPNLAQTIEGVPAFVHGGPFANIAHGCNSLVSTKLALKLADYVVTEAGFGSDLGAEKFFDIKCRAGELMPGAAVVVVTTKALKWQGGSSRDEWNRPDEAALRKGLANLERHISGLNNYRIPVVCAVNKYSFDDEKEINMILEACAGMDIPASVAEVWEKGGSGGREAAKQVLSSLKKATEFAPLYLSDIPVADKLDAVARKIYGADGIELSENASQKLGLIKRANLEHLPVCIAKTQFSFTDDPKQLGAPVNFSIHVKDLKIAAGAGYIVAYTGDIMTMPGLPKHPAAEKMDIDADGRIKGIF